MARLVIAVLLVLGIPVSIVAQPPHLAQSVFVDRSGSMRAYYQSGLVRSIVETLDRTLRASGGLDLNVFSTDVSPVQNLDSIDRLPFGNFTYLDKVTDACEHRHIAICWIVTDNIEDTGEVGNTERFYTTLRSADVLRVMVFPVLASPGKPGLIVYALLLDGSSDALYEQTLNGFATNGAGTVRANPLRMKPVDRDTVGVTSRSLAPLTRRGRPKLYDTGTPIREAVDVRFQSKFDHIQIVDSALHVAQATAGFQNGSLLVPEKRNINVTPDRIRSLGPGKETEQVYLLSVDMGKVRLKSSPIAWWKAAWNKPEEEAELDLKFQIDVPKQNFQLTPQFLKEYSASTVDEARATGKVYAIDRLMSQVNAQDTHIQVDSPLYFRIRYPAWPAIFWIVLMAIAVAILIGLVVFGRKLFAGKPRWNIRATSTDGRTLATVVKDGNLLVDGEPIAKFESGNEISPIAPARLGDGGSRIRIFSGARIAARTRRNDMELLFEAGKPVQAGGRPSSAPPPPSIRRR